MFSKSNRRSVRLAIMNNEVTSSSSSPTRKKWPYSKPTMLVSTASNYRFNKIKLHFFFKRIQNHIYVIAGGSKNLSIRLMSCAMYWIISARKGK